MDLLRWTFELGDKLSGPAGAMARALGGLEKAFWDSGQGSEETTKKFSNAALELDAITSIASKAGSALFGIAQRAFGLAESGARFAIEAVSFKQTTSLALEAILGSKKEAHDVMEEGVAFAAHTPFKTDKIMDYQKQFLVGGYKHGELDALLSATTDFGSLKGGDTSFMDRFVFDLVKIKSEGRLTGRVMESLAEAGVPAMKVYEQLGKIYGVTGEQAKGMAARSMIASDDAVTAIGRVIAGIGGGQLGNVTEKMSHTIPGLLSTISSRPFELFKDLDETGGMASFAGFLANVATLLDPASPFGTRLKAKVQAVFGGAFGGLFEAFSGAGGMGQLEEVMGLALTGITAVADGFKRAWPYILGLGAGAVGFFEGMGVVLKPLGSILGGIFSLAGDADGFAVVMRSLGHIMGELAVGVAVAAGTFGLLFVATNPIGALVFGVVSLLTAIDELKGVDWGFLGEQIGAAWEDVKGFFKGIGQSFVMVGSEIMDGIVDGITGGLHRVVTALEGVGEASLDALKGALGINSPSTEFAELGRYSAQGFNQGLMDGAGGLDRQISGVSVQASAGSSSGGGGVLVRIESGAIVVMQQPGEDGQALAEKVLELVVSRVSDALERGAAQLGAV